MSPMRERLEAIVEQALEMLDRMDGDCDIEENGDQEPSLCTFGAWHDGQAHDDDRELDNCDHELEEPTRLAPQGSWIYGGANAA